MQLDGQLPENAADSDTGFSASPTRRKALPPLRARAFGQKARLQVTADRYLRDDSDWRVRSIYEPFLTSQTLAPTGTALDIGAGYGCFAVLFALANPGWTVWAFEPEAEAFAALRVNIRAHRLTNVIAVNAAVTGAEPGQDVSAIAAALAALSEARTAPGMTALLAGLPEAPFRRHVEMRGVIEAIPDPSEHFDAVSFKAIPAAALLSLSPTFLKLTAPMAEQAILHDLIPAPLDYITGECWSHVPAALVHGPAQGMRHTWLPRAGDLLLRLRRTTSLNGHRPGLDVVVAMYNTLTWIKECVDAIVADGAPDIRALVVDDGSTDGCGDFVRDTYAGNPNVILLTKENGGCASARNFGRMNSDASHIAFVDADDVPGPGLFSGLLDLARHTGAEMVQGGFDLLLQDGAGGFSHAPSYESDLSEIIHAHRHNLGERTCFLAPSWLLLQGQPSIWRRVYRRDFLDNRNIWFPEHIRAFDDQIFQLLTLQSVFNVPMLDGVSYGYRQHPGQDIKQGDERNFYSLEMFRMVLKRGVNEGWNDFRPVLTSFIKTVNWCHASLRPDLRPAFLRGAAELWAYARNTVGHGAFEGLGEDQFDPPDFGFYLRRFHEKLTPVQHSYGNVYLDSIDMHPTMLHHASPAKPGAGK
jgi:glycosyltransferase involved in cell wall biosynthesis